MEPLKSADQRKISEFVRELYCLGSIKAISERVVETLGYLISGNSSIVVLNEINANAAQTLAENVGPGISKTAARNLGFAARASWIQISSCLCGTSSYPLRSALGTSVEKDGTLQPDLFKVGYARADGSAFYLLLVPISPE